MNTEEESTLKKRNPGKLKFEEKGARDNDKLYNTFPLIWEERYESDHNNYVCQFAFIRFMCSWCIKLGKYYTFLWNEGEREMQRG